MKDTYEITLEKEILTEIAAGTLAVCHRYLDNHNIPVEDVDHPLSVKKREVAKLQFDILGLNTMEELQITKNKLKEADRFLDEWQGV